MNNAKIVIDSQPEEISGTIERLRSEEARIVRIIEATQEVARSKAWSTLKTELFENLVNILERELKSEAKKPDPDTKKLNRLSGELGWAEKYADMSKLENTYKIQLQGLRTQLYGKRD